MQSVHLPSASSVGYLQPGAASVRPQSGGWWWGRNRLPRGCFHRCLLQHGEPVPFQQRSCAALKQGFQMIRISI